MRKLVALEAIIVVLTVSIASASMLTHPSTHVADQKTLTDGQMSFLNINLKAGQTVTGTFNFSGGDGATGFQIYDPNSITIVDSQTHAHLGSFVFTACTEGDYSFDILYSDLENYSFIGYEYSVTTPILGLNTLVFAGLVIATGTALFVAFAFVSAYLKAKK